MSRDWEQRFRAWSKPSSPTEQEQANNAERMIRDAIIASKALAEHTIEVFAQGSYKNNTNVREESDVDICVRCMDVFFSDFSMAEGITKGDADISDASYTYAQFKNDVGHALVAKFGQRGVTRGNKAFDVHENSYRVDTDVVACFEHSRYTHKDANGKCVHISGTEFRPDDGGRVINWPEQQYENGVWKNGKTGNRFKFITRALKRLRNEMADEGVSQADPIASFLIESLVWNVPNEGFGHEAYADDVPFALAHTFNNTMKDDDCKEWGEVSDLKYHFRGVQPWTPEQAHTVFGPHPVLLVSAQARIDRKRFRVQSARDL